MMKKTAIAAFLLVLLFLTMIGTASAQTRLPGVFPGNTFTYDVSASWSSTDPNAAIPSDLLDINKTEYYRVTITSVVSADVSTQSVWRFTNGTEISLNGTINVETGISSGDIGAFWAIVAGNLNVNDQVHPSGRDFITVNETATRNYTSGPRETNHLILSLSGSDTGGDYIEYVNYYFDKLTGMLVQLSDVKVYSNPSQTISKYWKIKDSNVGLIPEPTSTQGTQPTSTQGPQPTSDFTIIYIVIAAIAIIIPIGIFFVLKRRNRFPELEDLNL
jgi:hypothetical protein